MAEITSGNLTVIVLNEEEADALSIALSMVYGTEDLDEIFGQALMYYKQGEDINEALQCLGGGRWQAGPLGGARGGTGRCGRGGWTSSRPSQSVSTVRPPGSPP